MINNNYIKTGAAILYLASAMGCAVVSTEHKHFEAKAGKSGFHVYARGNVAKNLKMSYKLPKEADTNLDGVVDTGEARKYIAKTFRKIKDSFKASK